MRYFKRMKPRASRKLEFIARTIADLGKAIFVGGEP
jgi:hypothetical protein